MNYLATRYVINISSGEHNTYLVAYLVANISSGEITFRKLCSSHRQWILGVYTPDFIYTCMYTYIIKFMRVCACVCLCLSVCLCVCVYQCQSIPQQFGAGYNPQVTKPKSLKVVSRNYQKSSQKKNEIIKSRLDILHMTSDNFDST